MNIFKMFILLFKRDPLKKEFRRAKRIRKHNAKGMTTYEKILSYPLEYGHKLDKYLKGIAEGDPDLLQLLKNIHKENTKLIFFPGSKFLSEISLSVAKNVWKKLSLKNAIGLELAKSPRFAVSFMDICLASDDFSRKVSVNDDITQLEDLRNIVFDIKRRNIELVGTHLNMPLPIEIVSGTDTTEIIEQLSSIAIQKLELDVVFQLMESARTKKTFSKLSTEHLDSVFTEIKDKTYLPKGTFFIISNEETSKKIPQKLSEEETVSLVISEAMADDEILVTFMTSKVESKTISTYLYSLRIETAYIDRNNPTLPSLMVERRLSTEIFSPNSIAVINLK
jgi:hypothetical protein